VAERVADLAIVESAPRQDGRNMTMVLNPTKKPAKPPQQQQQQRAPKAPAPATDQAAASA
jgi:translation initiation factor IF-3